MISDVEHLFMYCWPSVCPLGKNFYSDLCSFLNWIVWGFLLLNCRSSLYIWILTIIRYMICKYFLPFSRLPFHFVDGFLCCEEAFSFVDIAPLVYFYFCCFCFWCQIQKIITKIYVKELTIYVFFLEFYGIRSYIQVFNPL